MLVAVIDSKEAEDPGIGTTTVRIDPNDRQTGTMSVGIDLTARQNQDDPMTGTTSVKTDPSDYQASGDPGIRKTTRKAGLIDHLDPGNPGSRDDRARGSGQSRQLTSTSASSTIPV